jgi:hypothetical protein
MSEEMDVEHMRDVANILGSFEQESTGHILAGPLTVSRRNAFLDLMKATRPFEGWDKVEDKESAPQSEEQERLEFVKEYKEWTEKGGEVRASRLQYTDAPSPK